MEIKQYRDEPHMSSYQRAIADVPTVKLFISLKLKSSDIQLENDKEKYTWSAEDRALFKVTDGNQILAAKVKEPDIDSETFSMLIHLEVIQPHIAICFIFLRRF